MKKSLRHKLKQRWLPFVYGYLCKLFLHILGITCRYKVDGLEAFTQVASKEKCILMFWHNRLGMISEIMKRHANQFKYAALISYSRDGEVISVLANSYKNGRSIRIPHNARSAALQTLITELKKNKEIMIITPDGPKGPKYKVKPGVAIATKEASAYVIPMTWSASRYWTLPTWDKLMIPKPFSTIRAQLGTPISFSEDIPINERTKVLQEKLLRLD